MSHPIHDPQEVHLEALIRLTGYFMREGVHWRFRNHYLPSIVAASNLMEVHWLVQLAQCWVETGGGTHEHSPGVPGAVRPDQHNLCGLKRRHASGDETEDFQSFSSPFAGAVGQSLHLRRYAGLRDHPLALLDPRWDLVSPWAGPGEFRVSQLSGTWATDPEYGDKVQAKVDEWEPIAIARTSGVYDLSLGVTPLWMPLEVTAE